ncbi:DUF2787 family protein [Vibrio parahaemolyticus]|uniref:DUF2787 family protein n=1 Tax=Vibrio parahaemolyticus TaxID=670 RepID=UPI00111D2EC2|nr:DUF2787 family protein [Vibrio parahaemolyticus]EGQ8037352.1 DUF2787 domain-containing protein [Vibrio parahaemolyticus]EHH2497975.1 DUF2787 domain-containing protein [Vibrio parahaemolyticus]EHR0874453.1 DUF2787 family protein [Vibrio parahaemolyticus]EID4326805.1 DUF2787 family protein [Vibrio parahaemolyticus]EJT3518695.1 DUF2787 family protein [Vibrio parahaemolyticus]
MSLPILNNDILPLSNELQVRLCASLELCAIPEDAKRIALNFRDTQYYQTAKGPQPVEIHLTRDSPFCPWHIAVMASFAYPSEQSKQMEVQLYFNFRHGWFYQPDIERCDLDQPEVIELFQSWDKAFVNLLNNKGFNQLTLSVLKTLLP